MLAPLAASMRLAMLCAACLSGLQAALVLAPPAPAMHATVLRAALSSSKAALVLAAPAASVRLAVLCAYKAYLYSRLGAVHRLAALAASMRHAVRRATFNS